MKFSFDAAYGGELFYGMPRETVRKVLNTEYVEFQKYPDSLYPIDKFDKYLFCFYDDNGCLSELEIFRPNRFIFNGCNLFELNSQAVLALLCDSGIKDFAHDNWIIEDDGVLTKDNSFGTIEDKRGITEYVYINFEKIKRVFFSL